MFSFAAENTKEGAVKWMQMIEKHAGALPPALGQALEKLPGLKARGAEEAETRAAPAVQQTCSSP